MADYQDDTTASNYSIQPGSNHPPIPDPIDVRDHPARDMPDMEWGAKKNLDLKIRSGSGILPSINLSMGKKAL